MERPEKEYVDDDPSFENTGVVGLTFVSRKTLYERVAGNPQASSPQVAGAFHTNVPDEPTTVVVVAGSDRENVAG